MLSIAIHFSFFFLIYGTSIFSPLNKNSFPSGCMLMCEYLCKIMGCLHAHIFIIYFKSCDIEMVL